MPSASAHTKGFPVQKRVVAVIGSREFRNHWYKAPPKSSHLAWSLALAQAGCEARRFILEQLQRRLRPEMDHVISGAAPGPDSMGIDAAHELGCSTEEYKAEWKKYGKRAGFLRNTTLAEKADWVIAFWDGDSRGTKDTILKAHEMGKRVTVVYADGRMRENFPGDDDPNGLV